MLAVRSDLADIAAVLGPSGQDYEISCINGHRSIVLGGTKVQLQSVRPKLEQRGLSVSALKTAYAFHTTQVDTILSDLAKVARGISFSRPRIPIISPACGKVIRETIDLGPDFATKHCRGAVNMLEALRSAREQGLIDDTMTCIELGPGTVVAKMVQEATGPSMKTFASFRNGVCTWKLMTKAFASFHCAGISVDWSAYHKDHPSCHRPLELPTYKWDLKPYWIQYTNDWSLRKGEPPLRVQASTLQSTTIHTILKETLGSTGGELVVETDLSRQDVHAMVQGHKVYGIPLCTPSVYTDIALTIGRHIKPLLEGSSQASGVEVADMTIQSALVVNSHGVAQVLQSSATLDETRGTALCSFSSVDNNGKILEQHAHCTLRVIDLQERQKHWQTQTLTTQSRMQVLRGQLDDEGNTFRFGKSMIYKMVSQLADFDPNYRGLVDIIMNNDELEALGKVSFKDIMDDGDFHTNPAYIDSLSQLGGFVMNANEGSDLEKEVFVNHGWANFQLFKTIQPDITYQTHVKMTETHDKLWTGDVVVFDEQEVVAVFEQVAVCHFRLTPLTLIANLRTATRCAKTPHGICRDLCR